MLSKGFALQDVIAAGFTIEASVKVDNVDETTETRQYDRFRFLYKLSQFHCYSQMSPFLALCRDRMMIPIKNEEGEIVGFGGRIMNTRKNISYQGYEPAKYGTADLFNISYMFLLFMIFLNHQRFVVNSPTSSLFKKGKLLYGMDLARPFVDSSGQVLIVEG